MIYRKIWEDHNGPIPRDEEGRTFEIHHIDGNRQNNDISNLACLSILDHYNIHYGQEDWGACMRISQRMSVPPELHSELARKHQLKRISDGTHQFLHNKTTGIISAKDKNGNNIQVTAEDPRWISGELVGVRKNSGKGRPKGCKDLKKRKVRPQMKVGYQKETYENAKIASKVVGLSLNRVRHNCVNELLGWRWIK
jgi:hypothetical protein